MVNRLLVSESNCKFAKTTKNTHFRRSRNKKFRLLLSSISMYAIILNAVAVIIGSAIGALARKGIREKYITVLNTAMGLAAIVLGINVAMEHLPKSHFRPSSSFVLPLADLSVRCFVWTNAWSEPRSASPVGRTSQKALRPVCSSAALALFPWWAPWWVPFSMTIPTSWQAPRSIWWRWLL